MILFETQTVSVIVSVVVKGTQGISKKIIKHGPLSSVINGNIGKSCGSERQIIYIL